MKNSLNLQPIEATNLNDTVYRLLREHILNHDFAPGERLDLSQLEETLQVSRTPLKYAVTRLETEGLIDIQARRGTFVAQINAKRLEETYKVRSAFELYVALCLFKYLTVEDFQFFADLRSRMSDLALAARDNWQVVAADYLELDRQLHERFIERGGSPLMVKLFQQMNVHMQLRRVVPAYYQLDFEATHFEHEQIFAAIESGSSERLNASLLNHLEASQSRVLKRLQEDTEEKE